MSIIVTHTKYRKLPIISGALTFEISSAYFRGAPTFGGGRLLSSSKKMLVGIREVGRTIKASSQTQRLAFIK